MPTPSVGSQENQDCSTSGKRGRTAAFNSELIKQKHEFNLKMDEMRAVVLSQDLKIKLLSKEIGIHCQAQLQATETLKALKEFCQQTQTQLQHKEQEVKELTVAKDYKYKQQLSAGLKREKDLKQMAVQLELEWQRRCEDAKAEHYLANEQLIQDLIQARDQARAELKDKEQELQKLTVLLRSVTTERDQAIQMGFTASEEISRLQEQNSLLRVVISQMREDMERLSRLLPQPQDFSPQTLHQGPPAPPHMARTSAQSTGISSRPSAAGGVSVDKVVNTEQQRRVAHIMEQPVTAEPVKMSGGSSQHVQDPTGIRPLMQHRLKQAALCIARLSREKQQLIEMNNRVRGQITVGGSKEMDLCSEKPGGQHERLTSLEQLQFQLTTQELQYTLRQRAATSAEQLLHRANDPAADPLSSETGGPETSKNKESTSHQSHLDRTQSSQNVGPQVSMSLLSSQESLQSLKQLWKIMDSGLSPSIMSEAECEGDPRRVAAESDGARVPMMVHGVPVLYHSQPPTEVQQRSCPPKHKISKPGAPNRISKIRNFNVKD